jgi:hypothetical protein
MQDNQFWAFLNKNKNLYWKGFCNEDRNAAIYKIEDIVNSHGYITDSHMYSDIEICLKIEIEEKKIYNLYNELKSYITINEVNDIKSDSSRDRIVLINITFTQGTGNLKIEVPAVPG